MEPAIAAVRKPTAVNKLIDPVVDIGNLLLIDNDPFGEDTQTDEESLLARARDNAQFLCNRIWELDKELVEDTVVVTLPAKSYRIPREKPIPTARPLTKWEQFAAEKGIVKKKKSKKVYDEASGEWKPTYGYGRAKDNTKDWLIEIPDNKDPNVDYFEERIKAKKERVAKNETQRLKNIARQMKVVGGAKNAPVVEPAALSVKDPTEKTTQELRTQLDRVRVATASLGKFDAALKGDKPNAKKGIKRKFEANIADMNEERERSKRVLERLNNKKASSVIKKDRVNAVAGNVEQSETKKSRQPPRQKSQLHRQKFFDSKIKKKSKAKPTARSNAKSGGKARSK